MAKKTTQQVRVNTTRYLDENGLDKLWDKIKEYVKNNSISIDGEDIDLSIYATKEYVDDALANIDTSDIDLTGYTTKEELTNELLKYAKKEDLDLYATKTYVDHAVSTVDTDPGIYIGTDEPTEPSYTVWIDTDDGEVAELDNYYTKDEVDALIPVVDLSTKADVNHTHPEYLTQHQDISGKADVVHTHSMADITDYVAPTIPDLSGYVTTDTMNTALSGKANAVHTHDEYLTEHQDLSLYALKTEIPTVNDINSLIDAKLGVIENGTY